MRTPSRFLTFYCLICVFFCLLVSLLLILVLVNSMRVNRRQQNIVHVWSVVLWRWSSVLWLQSFTSLSPNSSGVKRFRLSWRKGWLFTPAGLVCVCVSTILCTEDGRAFVPKHFLIFTPPNVVQTGGNSSSLTRVVFPVGWLVIQQSPQECRKSDPKSPGTNGKKRRKV